MYIDKNQSFLQVDDTIFGRPGQVCPDSQSSCKFLQGQYLKEDFDKLSFWYIYKNLHESFKSQSNSRILQSVISYIYFLHVDQYQSFLQFDTMVFSERGQAYPES